jgi:hypothetical protein
MSHGSHPPLHPERLMSNNTSKQRKPNGIRAGAHGFVESATLGKAIQQARKPALGEKTYSQLWLARFSLLYADDSMKKYLVFTFKTGQARGGMGDFTNSFDSFQEALLSINDERNRFFQIVESSSMKVVKEGWAMFKFYDPTALDLDDLTEY